MTSFDSSRFSKDSIFTLAIDEHDTNIKLCRRFLSDTYAANLREETARAELTGRRKSKKQAKRMAANISDAKAYAEITGLYEVDKVCGILGWITNN